MRRMSCSGGFKPVGVIGDSWRAGHAAPVRVVSRRVVRRGGLGLLAVLVVVLVTPRAVLAGSVAASGWTRQSPAASPAPRDGAAMAYDAATGDIVLFGGVNGQGRSLGDTWTWDGSTWARQSPATHPHARYGAPMAYDAATSDVVLFGGHGVNGELGGTWTWGASP
jgi:Galactose oxidase, central domain